MTDDIDMKPPPRLMDDPAVAPELQEGLSEIAATQLPFDTAAGLSSFQEVLGSAAGAAPATPLAGGVACRRARRNAPSGFFMAISHHCLIRAVSRGALSSAARIGA